MAYWIVLYADGTYEELYNFEPAARGWATERQVYRGGSYCLVKWN